MESVSEILGKKEALEDQARRADLAELERKVSSDEVVKQMKYWLKIYHNRKTSHSYQIVLRCIMRGTSVRNWRYFIEMWMDGKLLVLKGKGWKRDCQYKANAEFFDLCERNTDGWEKLEYGDLCFLKHKHTQSEKVKQHVLSKRKK